LVALANEILADDEPTTARQLLTESLTLAERAADRLTLTRSLEALASLLVTEWPARAVRLAGTPMPCARA